MSRIFQLDGMPAVEMSVGEAVESELVNNQTLGYYLARCAAFLEKVRNSTNTDNRVTNLEHYIRTHI